jgi:hypothetical protein
MNEDHIPLSTACLKAAQNNLIVSDMTYKPLPIQPLPPLLLHLPAHPITPLIIVINAQSLQVRTPSDSTSSSPPAFIRSTHVLGPSITMKAFVRKWACAVSWAFVFAYFLVPGCAGRVPISFFSRGRWKKTER